MPDSNINQERTPRSQLEILGSTERPHEDVEVIKNSQGVEFLLPPPQIQPSGFLSSLRKSYQDSQPLHQKYIWVDISAWMVAGAFLLPAFLSAPYHWKLIGLLGGWVLSGLSLLYASMKFKFGKESIYITKQRLQLGISFMGRRHTHSYDTERVKNFRLASDTREHDGYLCFDYGGQTINFAHAIDLKTTRWLFHMIEPTLVYEAPEVRTEDSSNIIVKTDEGLSAK